MVRAWRIDGEANAIAVGGRGEIYVNINNNHRVVRYSRQVERLGEFEIEGNASAMAVDGQGRVLVALPDAERVVMHSPEGEVLAVARIEGRPVGLAVTPNQTVVTLVNSGQGSICVEDQY
jgi:sugar lactone lactonase YvrE